MVVGEYELLDKVNYLLNGANLTNMEIYRIPGASEHRGKVK